MTPNPDGRILLACVDSPTSQTLTGRLQAMGHTVCAAAMSWQQAVERVADLRPGLALVDLEPASGGVEAAERIGSRFDVPVLYLVGDVDDELLGRARATGPFGYLLKPLDDRQLRLSIDAALRTHATQVQGPTGPRHRHDLLNAVFEEMSDGVAVTDRHGKFVLVNPAVVKILSGDPAGNADRWREAYDVFKSDERTPAGAGGRLLERALRGETPNDAEVFVRRRNRSDGVHLAVSTRPLHDARGQVRGGFVILRDVTQRKRARAKLNRTLAALQQQTELMESVFDSMSDGVAVFDSSGRHLMLNRAGRRLARMDPKRDPDLTALSGTFEFLHAEDMTPCPHEEQPLARVLRGESFDAYELCLPAPAGEATLHLSVSGRPLFRRDGVTLRGGVTVFRDVTHLRNAEQRMRQAHDDLERQTRFMKMIFEGISDGVVVADANGELTYANKRAERMVGMGIADAEKGHWSETYGTFFADEQTPVPEAELPLVRAVAGEPTDNVDLFVRNSHLPQGIHLSVSGRPLRDASGALTGGAIVLHDSTQQMEMQKQLLKAFASGRLEIIDTVLHNIGNAVNSVATGTDTLLAGIKDNELLCRFTALADAVRAQEEDWIGWLTGDPQGRLFRPFFLSLVGDLARQNATWEQTVERVFHRLRHVIDILRTQQSSVVGTIERTIIDLRSTVDDAVRVVRESSSRDIAVEVDCSRGPDLIRVQESQFHQMLVNLLKNAVEAIDERARRSGGLDGKPLIRVVTNTEKDTLVLDVIDNGIGIEPESRQRMFWAGYSTKATGSGLGLHSAANFVTASGGRIVPLSAGRGRGTTMRVLFRVPGIAGGKELA